MQKNYKIASTIIEIMNTCEIPIIIMRVYLYGQRKRKELCFSRNRKTEERSEYPLIIVTQYFNNGSFQSLTCERLII